VDSMSEIYSYFLWASSSTPSTPL